MKGWFGRNVGAEGVACGVLFLGLCGVVALIIWITYVAVKAVTG